ncbi:MAG: hypothetical protein AB7Q97_17150 [Gammaproteobacteria bacterium]
MTRARLAAMLAIAACSAPAMAAFTELPTTEPVRIFGSNNPAVDPFFLEPGELNPVDFTFELPAYLSLLAVRETAFELPSEDEPGTFEEVGVFQDAVFRDTSDGRLVFGSRIVMDLDEEGEINDIFRSGFTGFSAAAAWVPATANDLNLFSAGRTANSGLTTDDPDAFDPDIVALGTDVNVAELKASTAWYLIKTNAPDYAVRDDAIGLFQAGEEDQEPYLEQIDGFAPVPLPAALPMLLSALGALGLGSMVRRSRRAITRVRALIAGAHPFRIAAALALMLGSSSAHALFQTLPTAAFEGAPVARVAGFSNQTVDLIAGLKLPDGAIICPCPAPAGFVQLEARSNSIVVGGAQVGTLFDYVYRDTSDNTLVLGLRLVLAQSVNGAQNTFEVNNFFRRDNSGFTTLSAAWSRAENPDLRMYAAARTETRMLQGTETFSLDTVMFQSDVNVSEGNPQSGLFFLKSDALYYRTLASAISVYQAGEEGQARTEVFLPGFVFSATPDVVDPPPPPPPDPVPLPATLPMLLGALGALKLRRRRAQR